MKIQELIETKQRLDPKCWKGYKKQGTKMKGDTRVNNCVPESAGQGVAEGWKGAVAGGLAGHVLGGPPGAVVGATAGYWLGDRKIKKNRDHPAYKDGIQAHNDGWNRGENPYSDKDEGWAMAYDAWDQGWKDSKQGVAEGYTDDDIETTKQFRNAIAGLKAKSAIDKAKDGAGAKYYADGAKVTPQETARRAAERKAQKDKKGVTEGLDANQKKARQVPGEEMPKKTSPVLGKAPKQHPFKGRAVGDGL